MGELLLHLQYTKILFYLALGVIISTYIIHILFKRYRYPKYLPGFLLMIIGFFILFTRDYGTRKLMGIDNIFVGISTFASGIIGLCFALILGVYNKEKRQKTKE